jgi:EAL domain-containing protein (putative c-di-GMP-specific phosphodiesterase class I)
LPLQDSGTVEFASDDPGSLLALDACLGTAAEGSAGVRRVRYGGADQLLRLLSDLGQRLTEDHRRGLRCRIVYGSPEKPPKRSGDAEFADADMLSALPENGEAGGVPDGRNGPDAPEDGDGWRPASALLVGVGPYLLSEWILNRRFTFYFQPVVRTRDGGNAVEGYELLLRPLPEQPPFRPAEVVAAARSIGLHAFLERELMKKAILLSNAHLGPNVKRFINFLPSAVSHPAADLDRIAALVRDSGGNPADFVFDIEETERLGDIRRLADIAALAREREFRLALDVPDPASVSGGEDFDRLLRLVRPAYLKLGRRRIAGCHRDAARQKCVLDALGLAGRFGCLLLAEGVEDAADLAWLREAGVPLVQGYRIGPPTPVPSLPLTVNA